MRRLAWLLSALPIAAPAGAQMTMPLPADIRLQTVDSETRPRPWAIFFPRAAGVGSLVPGNQYADLATFLNQRGIDVAIIDDDFALDRLNPTGSAGEKRAAIAVDALRRLREQGRFDMRCPGLVVGWSRGGEGALTLASSASGTDSGIRAAIVYYPSVGGQPAPWPQRMPVLALQGASDATAPAKKLEALAANRIQNPEYPFTIKLYPGAKHRFDVAHPTDHPDSPVVEKDFDAKAHADALAAIDAFLTDRAISGESCALD